jgi:N-acetylglucosaminyl-diphospho-decaprenol L-rhamnosyltransferase
VNPLPDPPHKGEDGPDVSVIVVNWNTRDLLERCLRSIQAEGGKVQAIVVDNASSDGSRELVRRQFPDVELIANEDNRGFAPANNQGMERANGRYLLLLNSDAALEPGALQSLTSYADQHPEAGILGPKLLNPDGSLQPSGGRLPTPLSTIGELFGLNALGGRPRYGTRRDYDRPAIVDEVSGAAMLIARGVVDRIGGLDERFRWGYEDVDYCLRARRAGWQVHYVPQARVLHDWGGSRRLAPASTMLNAIDGRRWYFRKHFGSGVAAAVMLATALSHALRLIVFSVGGLRNRTWRRRAPVEWEVLRGLLGRR